MVLTGGPLFLFSAAVWWQNGLVRQAAETESARLAEALHRNAART